MLGIGTVFGNHSARRHDRSDAFDGFVNETTRMLAKTACGGSSEASYGSSQVLAKDLRSSLALRCAVRCAS